MRYKRYFSSIIVIVFLILLIIINDKYDENLEYKSDELNTTLEEFDLITNIDILYHTNYFKYEPLEENDYEKTLELIEPTLVNITRETPLSSGSGFIYKITPDKVYILSLSHVLSPMKNGSIIKFFDGSTIEHKVNYVRMNGTNEVALFTIPTSKIPLDTLEKLKQIHINYDIYDKLQINDTLVAYSKFFRNTNKDEIKKMTLYEINSDIGWINPIYISDYRFIKTNNKARAGMSGTPLVDCKGNLVGLVKCYFQDYAYSSQITVIPQLEKKLE